MVKIQFEDIEPDISKWDHSGPQPIVPTCSNCGSPSVTRDATVRWDIKSQKWELSGIFDNSDCDICGQMRLDETFILSFFGDASAMEQLPNEKFSVLAPNLATNDYRGVAFEGHTQIYITPETYSSAEEAKDAVRQWLFEQGML